MYIDIDKYYKDIAKRKPKLTNESKTLDKESKHKKIQKMLDPKYQK